MLRVLVTSYANVSESVTGRARRVNELLKALGDRALLVQPPPRHPACESVLFPADFGLHKVGINWGIFNLFWPRNRKVAETVIARQKPAAIVLTSTWDYPLLAPAAGIPLFLDAHNVDAIAIAERFGQGHPFTALVRRYERRVATGVRHIFTCSETDRQGFISLYGVPESRVSVVPNGVEIAEASAEGGEKLPHSLEGRTVLFFMGKLDYQPNAEALRFMSGTLMPALEREAPDRFKLLVCGGPVPRESFHRSVVFTGRVPSLAPYLRRADICLAPIPTGSGTRLKVLEYLGARKPVIATAKAVEGLGCTSGQQLLIAEPSDFASGIVRFATDAAERSRLAGAGFEFVKSRYDWANIRGRWRETIESCLK